MPEDLTLKSLRDLIAVLPRPPLYHGATAAPETCARLRKELNQTEIATPFGSITICEKPGQKAAVWVFRDLATMRKYLNNEITEFDLIQLANGREVHETIAIS